MSHGLDSVEGVDSFSLLLYSGDKQTLRVATELGWSGIAVAMGPLLMREVLQQSILSHSIFFVSQTLRHLIFSQFGSADLVELEGFLRFVILRRHTLLSPPAVDTLNRLLCVVMKRGFVSMRDPHSFPHDLTAALDVKGKECVEEHIVLSCSILVNLIDEMENPNNTSLVNHRRVNKWFRDNCLLSVFKSASQCLRHLSMTQEKALDGALRVVSRTLMFDFSSSWNDADEDVMTKDFPREWASDLLDQELQMRLWELYATPTTNPKFPCAVLETLRLLVSVKQSLFLTQSERTEWLEMIFENTLAIMNSKLHLGEPETLREFCCLLNRVKPNFPINEMLAVPCYTRWIGSLAEFTKVCFQNWRHARQSFLSLTSAWAKLVGAQSYCREGDTLFDTLAPGVCAAYVMCNIEQSVRFATDGETALFEDYFLDGDTESVALEFDFASQLLHFCGEKVESCLLEEVSSSLALLKGPATLSPVQLSCVCERLGWMITLISTWLKLHHSSAALYALKASIIVVCLDIIRQICALPLRNGPRVVAHRHLHRSFIAFLRTVCHILWVTRGGASESLLDSLRNSFSLQNVESVRSIILGLMVDEVLTCARFANEDVETAIEALNLLGEMARSPSTVATLRDLPQLNQPWVLDGAILSTSPSAIELYRVQCRFSRVLGQVHFCASPGRVWSGFFSILLDRLEKRICDTSTEQDDCTNAICSWRGMFLACTGHNEYKALLKRLSPCLVSLGHQLKRPIGSTVVVQSLRLINEISENRCCRISFGVNNVDGYFLFRYVSTLLGTVMEVVMKALGSPECCVEEWALKCLCIIFRTGRNILTGGYCNLGVFRLYHDETLAVCLKTLWNGMLLLDHTRLNQHEKLAQAFNNFVRVVFTDWYSWFLTEQPIPEILHVVRLLEYCLVYYITNTSLASQSAEALGSFAGMLSRSDLLGDLKIYLLQADQQVLFRILRLTLDIVISQRCILPTTEELLLSLILLEKDSFMQIGVEFAGLSAGNVAVCAAFENLCESAFESVRKNDRDLFAKVFQQFLSTVTECFC